MALCLFFEGFKDELDITHLIVGQDDSSTPDLVSDYSLGVDIIHGCSKKPLIVMSHVPHSKISIMAFQSHDLIGQRFDRIRQIRGAYIREINRSD